MKQNGRIILASASPRRKDLLSLLGLKLEIRPSDVDEGASKGDPRQVALLLTRRKVTSVRKKLGARFDGWIIGADTVVALDQRLFGKPTSPAEATKMLRALSGRTHQVVTAFRVERGDGEFREKAVKTDVRMSHFTPSEIAWYVGTGEPFDKAGGYAIQGAGGAFVKAIRGSYSNVVGLPLNEIAQALRSLGALKETSR